jgi:hypothetical protein
LTEHLESDAIHLALVRNEVVYRKFLGAQNVTVRHASSPDLIRVFVIKSVHRTFTIKLESPLRGRSSWSYEVEMCLGVDIASICIAITRGFDHHHLTPECWSSYVTCRGHGRGRLNSDWLHSSIDGRFSEGSLYSRSARYIGLLTGCDGCGGSLIVMAL